jgi:phosphonate ABC transporter permease subunit PhnE
MNNDRPRASLWSSIVTGLLTIGALLVLAYAMEVTQVDFAGLQSEQRRRSLERVARALADPDITYRETISQTATAPLQVPCRPEAPPPQQPPATDQPYIVVLDPCALQRTVVRVEGFNFAADRQGTLRLIPANAPSRLVGEFFQTDARGHFLTEFRLPVIDDQTEPVTMLATVRQPVGWPKFTPAALDAFDKIVETIFIALLATLFSAILAVPLSFLAARNIMEPLVAPFGSLMAALLAAPLGAYLGARLYGELAGWGAGWVADPLVGLGALVAVAGVLGATLAFSGITRAEDDPRPGGQLLRLAGGLVALVLIGLLLSLVAGLGRAAGLLLAPRLGALEFLGNFLVVLGDLLALSVPVIGAVIGLVLLASASQTFVRRLLPRLGELPARALTFLTGGLAVAVIVALVLVAVAWLRQIEDPAFWQLPAAVAGVLVALLTLLVPATRPMPVGRMIYYLTRTIFNVVRAVEALILVIVFAIWVGLGPFAGTLALALHNLVVLGKLYSEQVENILPGPLEAINATGATAVQTVVYGVIPQIVAPFIALTLYRWDVNVRSSTILGFAGGGGIGFILQQNINLLKYRSAATQIFAIAIVVILIDYASARIREKYV